MAKARIEAPASRVAAGEPVGRWAQVLAETRAKGKAIEPFDVTADLVLSPPTPARAEALSRATQASQAAIMAMMNAVKHGADQDEIARIQKAIEDSDVAYTTALVGPDKIEAVQAYFADRPEWERQAFYEALRSQFLRLPTEEEQDRIEQLEAQVEKLLAALAVADPDSPLITEIGGPGKEPGSSTTSTITSTNSNPTSPSTSTEPGSGTGASTDRGESSSTTPKLALA